MNPFLQHLGRSLPLAFFAALLIASQIEGQGPLQALAMAVGICAAGYYGAWAAHFFDYPRKYGRKAVLAAAKSLSWISVAFIVGLLATFALAPISGEPGELSQWLMFVVGLIASEVSIFAYSKQLHERMAAHQRAANSA
jgi:hypothetical protein